MDWGDLFNATESARGARPSGPFANMDPAELVRLNRYAQGGDVPATALLSAPYEGLKYVEQQTGIPALTLPGTLLNKIGVPVALPNERTSPASWENIEPSLSGAWDRITGRAPSGWGL